MDPNVDTSILHARTPGKTNLAVESVLQFPFYGTVEYSNNEAGLKLSNP